MGSLDVAVLVVEDEPLILMDAVDALEEAGFKVYRARHAHEAILLLEMYDDIRILFTDIDMPGSMDGLALAHAARDRWPPVHIIVTSGHRRIAASELPARGVFVSKPYRHDLLIEQIRQMAA